MQQNLGLGIPMRALLVIAAGLLMLPRSGKADYFLQNITDNGDVDFNQELAINNASGYTVVTPFGQADFSAESFPGGSEMRTQAPGINNISNTVKLWVDSIGATVPESGSLALLGIGVVLVALGYRRRQS